MDDECILYRNSFSHWFHKKRHVLSISSRCCRLELKSISTQDHNFKRIFLIFESILENWIKLIPLLVGSIFWMKDVFEQAPLLQIYSLMRNIIIWFGIKRSHHELDLFWNDLVLSVVLSKINWWILIDKKNSPFLPLPPNFFFKMSLETTKWQMHLLSSTFRKTQNVTLNSLEVLACLSGWI